jgi:hypothetical protein
MNGEPIDVRILVVLLDVLIARAAVEAADNQRV